LVKGDIETPNDNSGVVYVGMDNNDAWQFQTAKELKKSGYDVDMNKL
jgi:predicted nucleotide-binding protein